MLEFKILLILLIDILFWKNLFPDLTVIIPKNQILHLWYFSLFVKILGIDIDLINGGEERDLCVER